MSLIRQTLIDTKYIFLCSQWKMCFVCEAISRNIIYSVPKPMKKYLIPWMIICRIEKCFQEAPTQMHIYYEQDESFEFQSNVYRKKVGSRVSTRSQSAIKSSSSARLTAWTGFIATKVALLLAIKHLWLTWHIWQMNVFTCTAKRFILTSDEGSYSALYFYFSLSN